MKKESFKKKLFDVIKSKNETTGRSPSNSELVRHLSTNYVKLGVALSQLESDGAIYRDVKGRIFLSDADRELKLIINRAFNICRTRTH